MINKLQCRLKETSSTDLLSVFHIMFSIILEHGDRMQSQTEESKCVPFVMSIVLSKLDSFYADVGHQLTRIFIRVHYKGKNSFKKYESQEKKPYAIM